MNFKLTLVPEGSTADDVLAARYRAAWDKMKGGREQWIEGVLEMAVVVLDAREQYPANQEFRRWTKHHGLQEIDPNDRSAYSDIGRLQRKNPVAARKLLEDTDRISVRHIWRSHQLVKTPNRQKAKRKHEKPIPDVMRELKPGEKQVSVKINMNPEAWEQFKLDAAAEGLSVAAKLGLAAGVREDDVEQTAPPEPLPPPPERIASLKGLSLTREQVDPDFKGDAIQFAAEYGHVLLHTKDQITKRKRQDALQAWLGAMADHARTAQAVLEALPIDLVTLMEWHSKPAKAEKLAAWCETIRKACNAIPISREKNDGEHRIWTAPLDEK